MNRRSPRLVLVLALTAGACGDDGLPRDDAGDTGDAISDAGSDTAADGGLDIEVDGSSDIAPVDTEEADGPETDLGPYQFVSIAPALAQAGQPWTYAPEVEPSTDDLRIAIGPEDAVLTDGVLTWTPPARDAMPAEFAIDAFVRNRTVASQAFIVEVNHHPELLNAPTSLAAVGELWSHVPDFHDPDGDELTWGLEDAPDWLSIDVDGIAGVPTEAGEVSFSFFVDDGRGGRAETDHSISVVERIRDLSANTYHLGNVDAAIRLFGCCFDDLPDVYWGGELLAAERINAGRLDLSFTNPPRPGSQVLQLIRDALPIGELPRPITLLPEPTSTDDGATIVGRLGGASVVVTDHTGAVRAETTLAADTEAWSLDAPGVLFFEVDGVGSEPFVHSGSGPPVVMDIYPRIHEAGDRVEFEVSSNLGDHLTARWGEESSTCFVESALRCAALVPSGAAGFVSLEGLDGDLPSVVSGIAGSLAEASGGQWIDWANRRSIPGGQTSVVVIATLGGAPSSPDSTLELIQLTDTRAVIAVTPTDAGHVTIQVRDEELVLPVE